MGLYPPLRCCCVPKACSYQACLTASVNTRCLVDILMRESSKKIVLTFDQYFLMMRGLAAAPFIAFIGVEFSSFLRSPLTGPGWRDKSRLVQHLVCGLALTNFCMVSEGLGSCPCFPCCRPFILLSLIFHDSVAFGFFLDLGNHVCLIVYWATGQAASS